MVKRKLEHWFAILLAAVLLAGGQQAAEAQEKAQRVLPEPRVAVIDFQRAVRESAAGKSVLRQINERHARVQKEIQAKTNLLEQDRQELSRQQAILAPDVFARKRQEFQIKAQKYQKHVQQEQRKLDAMLRLNLNKVELVLAKELRDLATELGANIVIDAGPGRGSILFTDAKLVVTEDAKARLDKVLPDLEVVEPPAPQADGGAPPRPQAPRAK